MGILRTLAAGLLAGLLIFAGQPVPAAPSDDNAAPASPAFEAAMSHGDNLLAAGDNEGAERQFRIALQQGPTGEARADALHKLGIALAHQEKFDEAEPLVAEAEKLARARPGGVLLADVLRAKTLVLYRTGRTEGARAAFREAKRILETNANVWRTEAGADTWHHTPSDWRFPKTEGPFTRIRRTMLDETGHNIVVHYRIGEKGWGASLVSVYVSVDRGVPLAQEFEATRAEIIRQNPNARSIRSGPKELDGITGFETVIDLSPAQDGRTRRTSLTAFSHGNVLLRFRASYPVAEASMRADQVHTLVRAILRLRGRPIFR